MDEEEIIDRHLSLKDASALKTLWTFIKPYKVKVIVLLLLSLLVTTAFSMEPLIVKYFIDFLTDYTHGESEVSDPYFVITWLVILDTLVWIIAALGSYFTNLAFKKIGQNVIKDMRDDMFHHVLSLPLADLRRLKIGSYVTRITNDSQTLSSLFSDILPQILKASLTLVVIISTTFVVTGLYGFIFLAYVPIVFTISLFFRRKSKKYYKLEKNNVSKMNSFLSETFQGIKVVKTYERGDKKLLEFEKHNDDIYNAYLKTQNIFAIFYPSMYLLSVSCIIVVLLFGLPAVVRGAITLGTFNLLYSYSGQFLQPIQTITSLLNQVQNIITSAERIQFVYSLPEEIIKNKDSIDVPSFKGKIEFRHVYFAYVEDDYVLKDVSFIIEPGQTAAFVGPTGAGKSTIISLLSRTYDIQEGEILIDDVPIQNYSLTCLRRNIGVMLQDVFIFSGNIKDNISLKDENVSQEQVIQGAQFVGADRFIESLPDKYDTVVKERGANYSAGERQLISFARTVVYSPSLVLLDEATANIDTETENIIQSSLEKMRSIGTMLIVAHRLSTIKHADIIFVIQKGCLIEEGNHFSLLAQKGVYYNLYRLQNMEKQLSTQGGQL